jgi:chromosomal replication initiator protein
MPYKSIGNILGKKDHTTIMHGAEKITDDMKTNQDLRNKVELIRKKLNPT